MRMSFRIPIVRLNPIFAHFQQDITDDVNLDAQIELIRRCSRFSFKQLEQNLPGMAFSNSGLIDVRPSLALTCT